MKTETLFGVLERMRSVKLYVVTPQFCLGGYVEKPRAIEAAILVDVTSSVRVVFGADEVIESPEKSGTLLLTPMCKLTRRWQTHVRHLSTIDVPKEYMSRVRDL